MNGITRLKKGDTVAVLTGKDKGKTGKIIEVDRHANKVTVEAVNTHTRFQKKQGTNAGTKVTFSAPMPAAKVILICPHCGKATRIGHHFLENGSKQRICSKCKKAI